MAGGLFLLVTGGLVVWHGSSHYDLGTLRVMGPGMFPVALGFILAGFGLVSVVTALSQPGGTKLHIRVWTPLFVLGGIAAFAFMIRPFGLVPATLAATAISSLAELKVHALSLIGLCIGLCLLVVVVFHLGLRLPIPLFNWPF